MMLHVVTKIKTSSALRLCMDEALKNQLYYGDNLEVLRLHVKDESVDLIYLDPPFKSNQDYNILFAEHNGTMSMAQIKAFEDTWTWSQESMDAYHSVVEKGGKVSDVMQGLYKFLGNSDMMAYLAMMCPRLIEMHRVLKKTGSIYLHCDPTSSHYLKVLIDSIFRPENFQCEIVWKRTSAHSDSSTMGRTHDVILLYTKTDKFIWNPIFQAYDEKYLSTHYRYFDKDGRRYRTDNLTAKGLRGGGYEYTWKGIKGLWRCPIETMQKLEENGRIHYTKSGTPEIIRFLGEGVSLQDVWTDIPPINSQAAERLGFPTQKPEKLLERIIKSSSNEEDIVLDPFCGCGTTIAVAQHLNRKWLGIDITHLAITLIKIRLQDSYGKDVQYEVIGEPVTHTDAIELAKQDPYQFQWWALGLVGARPIEQKKGSDKGIDGRIIFFEKVGDQTPKQIIISVKSGNVSPSHIRDLIGVIQREKAEIGVYITLNEPTKDMISEATTAGYYKPELLGGEQYPKLQILTIEELLKGKTIKCPPFVKHQAGNITFKKAPISKPKKGDNSKQSNLPIGHPSPVSEQPLPSPDD